MTSMGVGAYGAMLRNRNRAGVIMGNNGVNIRTYGSCVLNNITTNSVINQSVAVVSNLLTGAPTTTGLTPQPSYAVQGGMLATQSYSTQTFNSNSILVPSTYYTTLLVQCPSANSGGITVTGTFTLSTMTVYFEVQSPNYPISTTALNLNINNGLIFQMAFTNPTAAVPTYYTISSFTIINLYRIGPNGGALFEVMFTPENEFTLVSGNYLNLILYGVTVSNGYTRL